MHPARLAFRVEASRLDDEAGHHAIKDRAVEMALLRVTEEVVDRLGRVLAVKLQNDIAHRGLNGDFRRRTIRSRSRLHGGQGTPDAKRHRRYETGEWFYCPAALPLH